MEEYSFAGQSRGLSNAAFALALISIALCSLLYLSIPFGSLAIILALLARGRGSFSNRGKLTVIIGITTILISIGNTALTTYRIYTNPELRSQLEAAMEYYYGFTTGTLPGTDLPLNTEGGDAA